MTKFKLFLASLFLLPTNEVLCHGGESHDDKKEIKINIKESSPKSPQNTESNIQKGQDQHLKNSKNTESYLASIAEINYKYRKDIHPIFKKACFNCHSTQTEYPWYYSFPIIKGLIDKDISEAQKHLIMTDNFPFTSHGTPLEDLVAISKSIDEGTMPPLKYQIMHWESFLRSKEKEVIHEWVRESVKLLK